MDPAQQSPWGAPLGRPSLALGVESGVDGGAAAEAGVAAAVPEQCPRLTWTRILPPTWRTEQLCFDTPSCRK